MYLRNAWYCAALAQEIGREPLGRLFLNQPVVMYRKADGTIAALEDRCCHRRAPLSRGKTEAFAGLAKQRVLPGPEVRTDAELDGFIRANMRTIYHPAGTCKIGTDPLAVVDPEFRVLGAERLRVIDASVMPVPIGGNLNAPVIMIAEKGSDMIRGKPPLPRADL